MNPTGSPIEVGPGDVSNEQDQVEVDDDDDWGDGPSASILQGQPSSSAGQYQRHNLTTTTNDNGDQNTRSTRISDCKFFFSTGGNCRKGNSCTFRHTTSALGSSVICEDWHGRRYCPLNDVCNKRHATRRDVESTNESLNSRTRGTSTVHSTVGTSSSSEAGPGPSGVSGTTGSLTGSARARRVQSTVNASNNNNNNNAEAGTSSGGSGSNNSTNATGNNRNKKTQNDCRDFIYKECPRGDACLLRHSEYVKNHRQHDIGICSDWRSKRVCDSNCRMRHHIPHEQFKLTKESKKSSAASSSSTGEPTGPDPDEDKIECKICYMEFYEIMKRGVKIIGLDCGHMVCEICCNRIMASQASPSCPYCRIRIRSPRPLFLN